MSAKYQKPTSKSFAGGRKKRNRTSHVSFAENGTMESDHDR